MTRPSVRRLQRITLALASLLAHGSVAAMLPTWAAPADASEDDQPASWRVSLSSARFSGPLTLSQLWNNELDKLETDGPAPLMYVRDEARASVRWGAFWLSWLARQSATLLSSRDAASVIQDIASRGQPAASYVAADVWLRLNGFAGVGMALRTSGSWPFGEALQWQLEGQGLVLKRLLWRDLSGRASYSALSGSYTFDALSHERNDHLKAPFQKGFASSGHALLFNFGVDWHVHERVRLHIQGQDLGYLWWQDLPEQTMRLSSSTSSLDAQGYLVYQPLLSGRNQQLDFRQRATSTWQTAATWQFDRNWQAIAAFHRVQGYARWLPYTGLTQRHAGWSWEAGWSWHERAWHLGWTSANWQLRFSADRLGSGARARALGLHWQGRW